MAEVDVAFIQELAQPLSERKLMAFLSWTFDDIGHACRQWGFFQIINHGVTPERLQKLEAAARKFFHLLLDEKRKVRRGLDKVMGYYNMENQCQGTHPRLRLPRRGRQCGLLGEPVAGKPA
ncbi:hypothetical protein QN277_004030 [Acacia crassicarpa]|uniref:Non-haem dioxygenase N-terminal domain-containing protein n=1 Tax=Acacia crassicarpa TaxID=499986 RepID=A0AAE1J0W6_9FABA|nr:hypothetical protein QN277_004030 [Acacia crassicarpa]